MHDDDNPTESTYLDERNAVRNAVLSKQMDGGATLRPVDFHAFKIGGMFDYVPQGRLVIHRQEIAIMTRIFYDVELSFLKNKFFVIVRRRVFRSNPSEKPEDQPQTRE